MRIASPNIKIPYCSDLWDTIFYLLVRGFGSKGPAGKITSKLHRKIGNRKSPYIPTLQEEENLTDHVKDGNEAG
jgi:hypothetical protein